MEQQQERQEQLQLPDQIGQSDLSALARELKPDCPGNIAVIEWLHANVEKTGEWNGRWTIADYMLGAIGLIDDEDVNGIFALCGYKGASPQTAGERVAKEGAELAASIWNMREQLLTSGWDLDVIRAAILNITEIVNNIHATVKQ